MPETKRTTVLAAEEILGGYFRVLDHGFIALVDYMGSDEDVERAARVSYGYGTRQTSLTRGLIRYLRRHLHTTPSEMVELKFHCAMPMFVARQWVRHRTASINEYSGRYSLMPLLFYMPEFAKFGFQSTDNNQGRSENKSVEVYQESVRRWEALRKEAGEGYTWMVEQDVARELARIDLPLSTYTQWYWKIDLHNLFHFLTLRADSHAQWEVRVYAEVMAGIVQRVAPLSFEAWIDYNFASKSFSRMEVAALSTLLKPDDTFKQIKQTKMGHLTLTNLKDLGLSNREVNEFLAKLTPAEVPNFELDLSKMMSAEEAGKGMERAVPGHFE